MFVYTQNQWTSWSPSCDGLVTTEVLLQPYQRKCGKNNCGVYKITITCKTVSKRQPLLETLLLLASECESCIRSCPKKKTYTPGSEIRSTHLLGVWIRRCKIDWQPKEENEKRLHKSEFQRRHSKALTSRRRISSCSRNSSFSHVFGMTRNRFNVAKK